MLMALYGAFKVWAENNGHPKKNKAGVRSRPSRRPFRDQTGAARSFEARYRVYPGIRLKPNGQDEGEDEREFDLSGYSPQ